MTDRERMQALRDRAESTLRNMSENPQIAQQQMDEIVHELRVYQIELELQNEELHRAQSEAQAAREEFERLFTFAPLAYLILDSSGIIRRANDTACRQFKLPRSKLLGQRVTDFVVPEDRDTLHLHLRYLLLDEEPISSELTFLGAEDTRFSGLLSSAITVSDDANPIIRSAITDISTRKAYEQHLSVLRELDQAILRTQSPAQFVRVALRHALTLAPACTRASIVLLPEPPDGQASLFSLFARRDGVERDVRPLADLDPSLLAHTYSVVERPFGEEEALLSVPIIRGDEQAGSIWLFAEDAHVFTPEIIAIMQDIARQIGIGVQHARLYQEVKSYAEELEQHMQERTRALHEREQSEYEQRIFAEAMLDIVRGLNSTLELDQVLERILTNLERVLPYDTANIMLLEDGVAHIVGWHGSHQKHFAHELSVDVRIADVPWYRHIYETGESILMQTKDDAVHWQWDNPAKDECAYVVVPIRSEDQMYGILNAYMPEVSSPSQTLARLQAFAEHAAIAISNAYLHRQKQHLTVLEERQRFGRDLHDAVSQTLFSLSITAEALIQKPDTANEQRKQILQRIVHLTRGAYAEMRLLLFELRSTGIEDVPIQELLTRLVDAFRGRKNQNIELTIMGEEPALSSEVKMHIYRIAQEALNNVTKYAASGDVAISLNHQDQVLVLLVQDRGPGFDLETVYRKSHGLSIMRKRAEAIGGHLTIASKIGYGTYVHLVLQLG